MVALPAAAAIPQLDIDTLVAGAAAGDVSCFNALYSRDAERVYNHVLRSCGNPAEAEDLCQEVWARASRSLVNLRDAGAFDTWVMRIATRACIDAARRRHVEYDEARLAAMADGNDVSEAVEEHEHRQLAWQALGALPQRQRLALYLREVDGLRYTDIAEALATTPTAVETLLFRARHSLAQAYDRLADSPDERCLRARQIMAVIMDGEGDAAEQRSLKAHLGDCHACQHHMHLLNRGKRAYAALPFAGVAGSITPTLLPAASGAGAGGVAWFGAGKLAALLSKATASFVGPSVAAATLVVGALTMSGPLQGVLLPASDVPQVAPASQTTAPASAELRPAAAVRGQPAEDAELTVPEQLPPPREEMVLAIPPAAIPQPALTAAVPEPPASLQTQVPPQLTAPPTTAEVPAAPVLQQAAPIVPPVAQTTPPQVQALPAVQTVTSLLPQTITVLPQWPAVQLGTLPSTLPSVSVPQVALPSLTTPQVSLPPVTVPQLTVPQITTPQVTLPQLGLPPITVPVAPKPPTITTTVPIQTTTTLPVALPPVGPSVPVVPNTLGLPLGR